MRSVKKIKLIRARAGFMASKCVSKWRSCAK